MWGFVTSFKKTDPIVETTVMNNTRGVSGGLFGNVYKWEYSVPSPMSFWWKGDSTGEPTRNPTIHYEEWGL